MNDGFGSAFFKTKVRGCIKNPSRLYSIYDRITFNLNLKAKKKYRGMFETQKVRRHDKFRKEWSQH